MKIKKTQLPDNSILNNSKINYDYVDSYQGILEDKNNVITPADLCKSFFVSGPKWVEKMFVLRNKIVSVIGLKTSGNTKDRQKQLENFKGEKGEQLGLFKVFDKTNDEVVLGEDDKHLNFRVSLLLNKHKTDLTKKEVTITTTVKFNNLFGRLYFLVVRPFHKMIVPTMLRGIITHLETENVN